MVYKMRRNRRGRTIIVVDIILYMMITILGYVFVEFNDIYTLSNNGTVPIIFFIVGGLTLFSYFLNPKRDNHEFLFLGIANIAVGAYVLSNLYYDGKMFVIGDALFFYSICALMTKVYIIKKLIKEKDIFFLPKLAITILIACLSIYCSYILYSKDIVATYILGYYFMITGLLSLLEAFIYVVFNNPTLDKYLNIFLKYETKETRTKTKLKRIKEVPKKKIQVKEVEGEIVKKEKNIKKNTKKK